MALFMSLSQLIASRIYMIAFCALWRQKPTVLNTESYVCPSLAKKGSERTKKADIGVFLKMLIIKHLQKCSKKAADGK